jgi:hypothetical protein
MGDTVNSALFTPRPDKTGHTVPMTIRFNCVLLCILLSGCISLVKISYPPEAVIHPTFDQPYTIWRRERVQVEWTPSLHAESFKYLARHDQVLLADSIRQRGIPTRFQSCSFMA